MRAHTFLSGHRRSGGKVHNQTPQIRRAVSKLHSGQSHVRIEHSKRYEERMEVKDERDGQWCKPSDLDQAVTVIGVYDAVRKIQTRA